MRAVEEVGGVTSKRLAPFSRLVYYCPLSF